MKTLPLFFCLAALLSGAARAADAVPARPATSAPPILIEETQQDSKEPAVQYIVIDGKETRIEETRVRGQTQRIVVKNKGPLKGSYEIVPDNTGRDTPNDFTGSRGNAGQRVWSVLSF
jgi:hypothetical protein